MALAYAASGSCFSQATQAQTVIRPSREKTSFVARDLDVHETVEMVVELRQA